MSSSQEPEKRKQKAKRERFPLTLHPKGYWCKRVLGKLHYFGRDQDEALKEWLRVKDALLAGRPRNPQPAATDAERMTLATLCNRFLEAKKSEIEDGELVQQSWDDYRRECQRLLKALGRDVAVDDLGFDDFTKLKKALGKGVGLKTLDGRVARCRAIFRFGELRRYVAPLSHKMADTLKKPSKKALAKERGDTIKTFTPSEIRLLLDRASVNMRAAILLGCNAGYGPQDIAELRLSHLDLERGWITQLRSKTGKPRRASLWQETREALRAVLESRRGKMGPNDRVFLTKTGQPLNGVTTSRKKSPDGKPVQVARVNPLSSDFLELRKSVGIVGKEKTFYTLRHSFKTVALNATLNEHAVDRIMGHMRDSVPVLYLQMISDERLREVTDAVRRWLFETDQPQGE